MTILPKKKPPPKEKKPDSSESETEELKVTTHVPHQPTVTASSLPAAFIEERQSFSAHRYPPEDDYYGGLSYEPEDTASSPQRKQYGSPLHPTKQRDWDSPELSGYNSSEEYESSRRIMYDAEVCLLLLFLFCCCVSLSSLPVPIFKVN